MKRSFGGALLCTFLFACLGQAIGSDAGGASPGGIRSATAPVFVLASDLTLTNNTVAWGDSNNDGKLDVLLHGPRTNGYRTELWTNNGTGFANAPFSLFGGDVPTVASVAWTEAGGQFYALVGRYDSITYQPAKLELSDVVLAGDISNSGRFDRVYAGWYTQTPLTGFPGPSVLTQNSSLALGDYDNDGLPDLLLTTYPGVTSLLRGGNLGTTNVGLPGVAYGSAVWGDYDNDGRLDILLTGKSGSQLVSQVWRNTGGGFSNINLALPGVMYSSVAWGDFDSDGRLDLLLTGTTNVSGSTSAGICQLWRNTGAGFELVDNAGLPAVSLSSVAWGDFDNDGRLDLLISGVTPGGQSICQVWRNQSPATNTPPAPPGTLSLVQSNGLLVFSWDAGSDLETPENVLTYNLRIGTAPGGSTKVAAMSSADGHRRVPQPGNRNRTHSWTSSLTNFPLGQAFYWSVQSVDGSFAGSPWAAEKSFRLLQWAAPTIVAPVSVTSLPVGDYNGNGVIDDSDLGIVYSNYFPASPWLQMTNVAGLGSSNVTFALTNSPAGSLSVEYSTNLTNWTFLGPATPRYEFNDTNASAGSQAQRFYRLRWP